MAGVSQLSSFHDHDIVPGTVYIVVDGGEHFSGTDIRLLPPPSEDLKDPLRWSSWRKYYHMSLLVAYSTMMGAVTNWESPIYLVLVHALNSKLSTLNVGRAIMVLMLGIGNVFLTPLSHSMWRAIV